MSDMNRNKKPGNIKEEKKYTNTSQYPPPKQQPLLSSYQECARIEENEYAYVDEITQFNPVHENTLNRKRDSYNHNGPHGAGHYTLSQGVPVDPRGGNTIGRKAEHGEVAPQYFVLDPEAMSQRTCSDGLTDEDMMYEKQLCHAHAHKNTDMRHHHVR